ncbi:MAG: hypothetical protein GY953_51470, partial [bacterium]|nr:hypothetical protein [bacterium]
NAVTIAIESEGNTCSDGFNPIGNAARAGGRIGLAMPHRYESLVEPFNSAPAEVTVDKLFLALKDEPGGETWFNPLVSLPPLGTCTFYGTSASRTGPEWIAFLAGAGQLDGGPSADLTGPLGMTSAPRQTGPPGIYEATLGKAPTLQGAAPPFLSTPAAFNLSLPGGVDVGAVNSDFDMAPPLAWTNRDQAGLLRRGAGYTLTWAGGNADSDVVLIAGEARNTPRNSAGIFLCVAPVTSGGFTVPEYMTSALPRTPDGVIPVTGEIFLGAANLRDPVRWAGPGLDAAFITSSTFGVRVLRVE